MANSSKCNVKVLLSYCYIEYMGCYRSDAMRLLNIKVSCLQTSEVCLPSCSVDILLFFFASIPAQVAEMDFESGDLVITRFCFGSCLALGQFCGEPYQIHTFHLAGL